MARNLGSKCKLCRRAGEKLFLKADRCGSSKCAISRRATTPGIHGKPIKGENKSASEYGRQMSQKQKIKRIYGVSEEQFRKHLADVSSQKGLVGDNLIARLEMRLDNVVYRLGLAGSRSQSRQLVSHGMFQVNDKILDIPSAYVKVGDVIKVKNHKQENKYFKEMKAILKKNSPVPGWLSLDAEKLEAKVLSRPNMDELGMNIDAQVVVEFYSR